MDQKKRHLTRTLSLAAFMTLGMAGGVSCGNGGDSGSGGGSGGTDASMGGDSNGGWGGDSGIGTGGNDGGGGIDSGGSGPTDPDACPLACDGPCWDLTCATLQRAIPDTDNAACLDETDGTTCPSMGEPRYGQDGNYAFPASEFVEGDATYRVDAVTGLVWTVALSEEVTHAEAVAHCAELAEAEVAGYDDWRLPTLRELYGTLQPAHQTGQATHDELSAPEPNSIIWSSNLVIDEIDEAWGVSSNWAVTLKCVMSGDEVYETHTARCVAGGPASGTWPALNSSAKTVIAPSTGLEWQRELAGTGSWTYALETCEALELDGKSDWRLPEARELASLLQQDPDNTLTGFPTFMTAGGSVDHWSSSPGSAFGQEVYYARADGSIELAYTASLEFGVRCVRTP